MSFDRAALVAELRRAHAVHTVILYGSHARGDATPESDIDVCTFADVERTRRDARLWDGAYLDAFVYPTAQAAAVDADMLRLHGGIVLLDERGLAGPLLQQLDELERTGPPPLTDDDRQMRVAWAKKTLERVRRGDVEAHYRRHQLLFELLSDYFALRGRWYRGPKRALAELPPATYARFAAALAPGAPIEAIAALVDDHLDLAVK